MASLVHVKLTYHGEEGRSGTVSTNRDEAKQIKEIIQKDILASTLALEVEAEA